MSTTSSPPHPQRAVPPALTLPVDVWLIILLESGRFNYLDLKSFGGVCRAFREIEQSPHLDNHLFRSPPSPLPLVQGQPIAWHPIFDHMGFLLWMNGKKAYFETWYGWGLRTDGITLEDEPVAHEFATTPACTLFFTDTGGGALAENAQGVTVSDVFQAVATMWSEKPPLDVCEETAALAVDPEYAVEDVDWRATLLRCDMFEGVQSIKVLEKGWVFMRANRFGR
ncbi:hypothetical protein JCM6882_003106 [Rhodosporidiobolus microsporus]